MRVDIVEALIFQLAAKVRHVAEVAGSSQIEGSLKNWLRVHPTSRIRFGGLALEGSLRGR